ncbi:transmembrane amino acid transporter protein-domain-containing protein [Halteromyces radiatus]|uniref:transmembrane amino acid transporter protein-domain-containing protein n=1 Tax=Halteromyces radiatus TaxID=101107 RepID=UPI00221EAAA8|nr:transmembrane amino acid transporter protein-domain-containing protein [Halteromyces radiatus]KAI8089900.1 transmembrane amino acid transporter protein-domain-containing protein [Halteromyces radiatus]
MTQYGSISTQKKIHHLTQAERDLLQSDRPGYGTRSRIEVAFNLVNATVGAGIIGLPFAISHCGFILGFVVSIFVAILSQLGLYMVVLAGQRLGIYKFALLVEYLFGRPGFHFLNLMIFIQAGGACISYFILLGDTIPILLEPYLPELEIVSERTLVMGFIGIFCILPLNLARSIGALAKWSILSVMLFPVVLLTIIIRAPSYIPEEPIPVTWIGTDVFGALGVFAFAFTCSQVAFNNYLTLEDQSSQSWCQSTTLSTFTSWLISMVFAILGYFCFGENVQPNLFMNFATDDLIINIGRFILGCTMILTIPLGFYPTREAVQKVLGYETATKQPNQLQHYTVTFVLFFVILFAGITIRSLGKVYGFVGGISATTLAFILPSVAYWVAAKQYRSRTSSSSSSSSEATTAALAAAAATISIEPTLTQTSTLYNGISNGNNGYYYSTVEDKQLLWDMASTSSSSRSPYYVDEEDVSTVDGGLDDLDGDDDLNDDYIGKPSVFLDIMAVVLFIWGFVVMILSVSSVLLQD